VRPFSPNSFLDRHSDKKDWMDIYKPAYFVLSNHLLRGVLFAAKIIEKSDERILGDSDFVETVFMI